MSKLNVLQGSVELAEQPCHNIKTATDGTDEKALCFLFGGVWHPGVPQKSKMEPREMSSDTTTTCEPADPLQSPEMANLGNTIFGSQKMDFWGAPLGAI